MAWMSDGSTNPNQLRIPSKFFLPKEGHALSRPRQFRSLSAPVGGAARPSVASSWPSGAESSSSATVRFTPVPIRSGLPVLHSSPHLRRRDRTPRRVARPAFRGRPTAVGPEENALLLLRRASFAFHGLGYPRVPHLLWPEKRSHVKLIGGYVPHLTAASVIERILAAGTSAFATHPTEGNRRPRVGQGGRGARCRGRSFGGR